MLILCLQTFITLCCRVCGCLAGLLMIFRGIEVGEKVAQLKEVRNLKIGCLDRGSVFVCLFDTSWKRNWLLLNHA